MSEMNPMQQYFLQSLKDAQFNLWNALLTINGVMISGFALLAVLTPAVSRVATTTLVVASCLSLLLVLWNYLIVKWHYIAQGRDPEAVGALPEDTLAKERRAAERRHKWIQRREFLALVLLLIEVLLVAFVVLTVETAA